MGLRFSKPRISAVIQRTVGPHYQIGLTGPKIFFFKFDPGALSYMPEDQFELKKLSISPCWYYAIGWQSDRWQENWVIFSWKNLFALSFLAHSRDHIFFISWCHMKALTCGYVAKVKKVKFFGYGVPGGWISLRKLPKKVRFFIFKASKVLLFRQSRGGTIKKEKSSFENCIFLFYGTPSALSKQKYF